MLLTTASFPLCLQGPAFDSEARTLQGKPLAWVHRMLASRSTAVQVTHDSSWCCMCSCPPARCERRIVGCLKTLVFPVTQRATVINTVN